MVPTVSVREPLLYASADESATASSDAAALVARPLLHSPRAFPTRDGCSYPASDDIPLVYPAASAAMPGAEELHTIMAVEMTLLDSGWHEDSAGAELTQVRCKNCCSWFTARDGFLSPTSPLLSPRVLSPPLTALTSP
eukprot:CAMPEP_0180272456 /NCGR_PEP_ID=MMETSP0988-20121125/4256_1 /TAXON_ID=697907 /ORGANISM="non described non described, Strain CCMP2293" /LENGTH=137 /DNA_ID=CAMNT_0022243531 /DNA_START=54 /DNA_END=463 /DNA_ORIENTATION=-